MKIYNNEQINNLIILKLATQNEIIKKENKNFDVIKALENNLNNDFKNNKNKPYNLCFLNQLNNYSLINIGVEITEKIYYEQLEILPPVYIKNYSNFKINNKRCINGFFINEPVTFNEQGTVYNGCIETEDNKFYYIISTIKGSD